MMLEQTRIATAVILTVAGLSGYHVRDILSPARTQSTRLRVARATAVWLVRRLTVLTWDELSKMFRRHKRKLISSVASASYCVHTRNLAARVTERLAERAGRIVH